jgi:hypothetical protein
MEYIYFLKIILDMYLYFIISTTNQVGNLLQGGMMKTSFFIVAFLLLLSLKINVTDFNTVQTVAVVSAQTQTPCVDCDNETDEECQRINTPNGPHIYYGNRSSCDGQIPPGG